MIILVIIDLKFSLYFSFCINFYKFFFFNKMVLSHIYEFLIYFLYFCLCLIITCGLYRLGMITCFSLSC